MDVFIGKQPILNKQEHVVAYRLVYRTKDVQDMASANPDEATMNIIINALFTFGVNNLTDNKPFFVHFSEKLVMHDFLLQLDPQNFVIELSHSSSISENLITRIEQLKQLGFRFALNNFTYIAAPSIIQLRLFNLMDIIKVDLLNLSKEEIVKISQYFKQFYPSTLLLAEKVDTREDYTFAQEKGYSMFIGYFFEEPKFIVSKDIEPVVVHYFEIMALLTDPEPDVDEIADTIERDISLTYKLLRLVNTTNSRVRSNITSIRQAIMLLGLIELQKWIYLLAMRGSKNTNYNRELIFNSLFRSKICEMLARQKGLRNFSEYYLVGMFSNIDALLQMPLEAVVEDLPFSPVVIATIRKEQTDMTPIFNLACSLQKLDWDTIIEIAEELDISIDSLETLYYTTFEWVMDILEAEAQTA